MDKFKEEVKIRRLTEADLEKVKRIDKALAGDERALSWPIQVV